MTSYLDLIERFDTGAAISKNDWDFDHIVMPVRSLVKKYQLHWNPAQPIPNDPELADRLYQAAIELAYLAGSYSLSSGRMLAFQPGEIETALRASPQELIMGEGSQARTLYARKVLDERAPLVWAGNPGCPTPERLFLPYVTSCIQEPIVDLLTCGSLTAVDGHAVTTAGPVEIAATRLELRLLRQGLRNTGRSGMGLLAAQSSVSELGDLAASSPEYLRPCDAHLVPILNELIMDSRNIARAVNSLDYGMRNASLACVMVGGLAGDAPGAALLQAASFLVANLTCRADYHLLHPIHIRHIATSTRQVMWVQSIVSQAFARNAPSIIVGDIYPKSGAVTRELLYEVAANAITLTVSGAHLEGVGSADGNVPNGTGLEARWMGEVGHAVTRQRIDLEQANSLVLRLLEKYEPVFDLKTGNPGLRFDLAYDMTSIQPTPAWNQLYQEVKQELIQMGLTAFL
ncbi:MAG: monomethylamine:corrinoid methyltransferase [Chloroflexi bacterium]|nr:monomethylamine:corrinoid methyltransferase [Chloroflexota bacterium]